MKKYSYFSFLFALLSQSVLSTDYPYSGSFQCGGDGYEYGTCYSPDFSDKGPNYTIFTILSAKGGNGYDFTLAPGEHAEFHLYCSADKIHSYKLDKNSSIKCSKHKDDNRHWHIECKNKSNSSHHHLNFKKFHCGPNEPSCDGGNECQNPDNPGG